MLIDVYARSGTWSSGRRRRERSRKCIHSPVPIVRTKGFVRALTQDYGVGDMTSCTLTMTLMHHNDRRIGSRRISIDGATMHG